MMRPSKLKGLLSNLGRLRHGSDLPRWKAQTFPLFAAGLIAILALTGFAIDGARLAVSWWGLQENADAACLAGATGWDPNAQLTAAGEPTATLTWTDRSLYMEVHKTEPVYFLQLVGISQLAFDVRTRCIIPTAAFLPIAVRESWLAEGLADPAQEFGILGQEADQAENSSSYAGAILPNVLCVDGLACEVRAFYGVDEGPSPNTYKAEIESLIRSALRTNLPDLGTHVPVIDGVSNKFLVDAVRDTYAVGDHLIVVVFSGTVDGDNPWQNVEILSYAEVVITDLSDQNTLWTSFVKEVDSLEGVNLLTRARTISWDWLGG